MPFPNLGPSEWVILGIVLVLFFGNKKMTEMAKGLGESSKELKKAKKEFEAALTDEPSQLKKVKDTDNERDG